MSQVPVKESFRGVKRGQDFKAILRDVMGEEKFYFSLFIIHVYVMALVVTV